VRLISATLASKPVISDAGNKDVAGAVTAALADPTIDANTTSEAAVTAILTAFGVSTGLKVFIDDSATPTRAQVLAALDAVRAQILSSSLYT
jgi:hypothetical protein